MTRDDEKVPPPEVFSLPVIRCPACGHGIDPHGVDPGGKCGVGWNARRCDCLWSPNDIAGQAMADLRAKVEALDDRDETRCRRSGEALPCSCHELVAEVLALLDGAQR